jgi:hypothetical protein
MQQVQHQFICIVLHQQNVIYLYDIFKIFYYYTFSIIFIIYFLFFLDGIQGIQLLSVCVELTDYGVDVGSEKLTGLEDDGTVTLTTTTYSDQTCTTESGSPEIDTYPSSYEADSTTWATISDDTTITIPSGVNGPLTLY